MGDFAEESIRGPSRLRWTLRLLGRYANMMKVACEPLCLIDA
jgi:hypothetical protein